MVNDPKNGMRCGQFEALLADALDGVLGEPEATAFRTHAAGCGNCGPMFDMAQQGRGWLTSLEEVEPPAHLVGNIIAATTGASKTASAAQRKGWLDTLGEWSGLKGVLTPVLQPRVAMSLGMAFFSLTLILNVLGIRVGDIKNMDLRPSAIERTAVNQYYATTSRVVRYYENLRFVYEVESRVRELKKASEEKPVEEKPPAKDKSSEGPEQKQNYSRELGHEVIARLDAKAGDPLRSNTDEKGDGRTL